MPNDKLKMSQPGLDLVKAFESCMAVVKTRPGFFKAYTDPVGVLTIGWGHTNHHLPRFDGNAIWSAAQCDDALSGDMVTFEAWVKRLAKVDLKQNEFDALVSWSFNTGGPESASLWKKLNAAQKQAVPAELAKWNRGGGKVLAGLTRRRKAEGLMFAGQISEALKVATGKTAA
jgi:lysozyme